MPIEVSGHLKRRHGFVRSYKSFAAFLMMTGTGPVVPSLYSVPQGVRILPEVQHPRTSFAVRW